MLKNARLRDLSGPPDARVQAPAFELTILMPCLDERETIETCVRKAHGFLDRAGVAGEVVVADNGSTDGSQLLALRAGARVILALERGYGAALQAGIAEAQGRYIIMGDADDSYDFENLDAMLAALRAGVALVMGNRFRGGIRPGAMPPLHRFLGNPALSFVGRLFFAAPIGDFHCGLRGFAKEPIAQLGLESPGMEFASEMVVKAALHGLSIAEVPTVLSPAGRSRAPHLRTWRDGWRHLRFLLIHSPRWLFLYPGLALVALGLVGMFVLSQGSARIAPGVSLDIHTLVASSFAVLAGAQLVLFSALARRFGIVEGFLPPSAGWHGFLLGMTLETILQGALVLFVGGIGGAVWALHAWIASDFGAITDHKILRVLVVSLTALTAAVQIGAAGFLGSILTIRRRRP